MLNRLNFPNLDFIWSLDGTNSQNHDLTCETKVQLTAKLDLKPFADN